MVDDTMSSRQEDQIKEATKMVDAPERIWAGNAGPDLGDTWSEEPVDGWIEYVRADLYEQVKRDNANLKDLLDDARNGAAKLLADRIRSEAAERLAGARVVTVTDILREWFGGERYSRDYEYLDANFSKQAERVITFLAALAGAKP